MFTAYALLDMFAAKRIRKGKQNDFLPVQWRQEVGQGGTIDIS
jgi:hypothetical protein